MAPQSDIKLNGVTYRLLPRKCGKPACKCNNPGQEHGPYWYAFDGNGGGKYVGAKLPEDITKRIKLIQTSAPQIRKIKAQLTKQRDELQLKLDKARREISVLEALERRDYAAPTVLEELGLGKLAVKTQMEG
jgi:hypothetical protein